MKFKILRAMIPGIGVFFSVVDYRNFDLDHFGSNLPGMLLYSVFGVAAGIIVQFTKKKPSSLAFTVRSFLVTVLLLAFSFTIFVGDNHSASLLNIIQVNGILVGFGLVILAIPISLSLICMYLVDRYLLKLQDKNLLS
jgi:hypothetical protein